MRHCYRLALYLSIVAGAVAFGVPATADSLCKRAYERPQQAPTSIAFAADSAEITNKDERRLRSFVQRLHSVELHRVCVVAEADAQGDADYNMSLAERRARAVAEVLRDAGLRMERITVDIRDAAAEALVEIFVPQAMDRRVLILVVGPEDEG